MVPHNTLISGLAHGWKDSGDFVIRWNGRDSAGRFVSSGAYIYRLEVLA
jgi:flagellar hook assembly protein FlgD